MNWTQEQLSDYATELKELYYSMEFDQSFKDAVLETYTGRTTYQNNSLIRDMLLTKLNLTRSLSHIKIVFPTQNQQIYADRARVTIGPQQQNIVKRPDTLQTNLFFTPSDDGILAIHNIHRFPDRELLAQQSAQVREQVLLQILSTLQIYAHEQIHIINDEGVPLLALPETEDILEDLLSLKEYKIVNDVLYTETHGNIIFSTFSTQEPLGIIKVVPKSEVIGSILPTVYTGLLLGLASLLVSILISAILSSRISKPVVGLAQRVKNIEMESLQLEEDEESADEVKVLEHHIAAFIERIRQLIRNEYDITLQSKTAQINALQAQINPHFLHNTLQLIGSIALAQGEAEVYRISGALSSLMRYSMDFNEHLVPLEEELKHLDNYLYIQKERFSERMSVSFSISPEVRTAMIPKLLLQPIIENSFMHGFATKSGQWKLSIIAFADEGKLHIIVKDNGSGMEQEEVERINSELKAPRTGALISSMTTSEHIGLINVNERIRLTSSGEDGVTVTSVKGGGTTVELVCGIHRRDA
jgi:two-component system sensor histidine kinase YesM